MRRFPMLSKRTLLICAVVGVLNWFIGATAEWMGADTRMHGWPSGILFVAFSYWTWMKLLGPAVEDDFNRWKEARYGRED